MTVYFLVMNSKSCNYILPLSHSLISIIWCQSALKRMSESFGFRHPMAEPGGSGSDVRSFMIHEIEILK